MRGFEGTITGIRIVLLTVVLLAGCSCWRKMTQQPDRSVLITQFGLWTCFPDLWAKVDASDRKVEIGYWRQGDNFTITNVQTSVDWVVGDGWFIFAEDHNRVWICTGAKLHLMLLDSQGNSRCYTGQFPVQIPTAVSQQMRRRSGVP